MTSVRELKICKAAWRWCSEAAALSWCSHSSRPGHSLLGTVNLQQSMPHQLPYFPTGQEFSGAVSTCKVPHQLQVRRNTGRVLAWRVHKQPQVGGSCCLQDMMK